MDSSINLECLLNHRVEDDDTYLVIWPFSIIVCYCFLQYLLDLSFIRDLCVGSLIIWLPVIELWQVLIELEYPLLHEEYSGHNVRCPLEVVLSFMQLCVPIDHYSTDFINPQIGYMIHTLKIGGWTLTESLQQCVHHSYVYLLKEANGTWVDAFCVFRQKLLCSLYNLCWSGDRH